MIYITRLVQGEDAIGYTKISVDPMPGLWKKKREPKYMKIRYCFGFRYIVPNAD